MSPLNKLLFSAFIFSLKSCLCASITRRARAHPSMCAGVRGHSWARPRLLLDYRWGLFVYCCTHRGFWGFWPDLPPHRGITGTSEARDFVSFSWDLGNLNSRLHACTASLWPPSCLPKMLPFTGFDYYFALVIEPGTLGLSETVTGFLSCWTFCLVKGTKQQNLPLFSCLGTFRCHQGKRWAGRLPFQ